MPEPEIEQILGRSRVYRLLSTAYLYPDPEFFSSIGDGFFINGLRGAFSCISDDITLDSLEASLKGVALTDLQAQHRRVFEHTISKDCPPYETQYGAHHIFQQAQKLGDIGGFYRAFGMEISEEAKERLDHISVELEFMHFLTIKEAHALKNHGEEKADICREAQKKFVNDHLGPWLFVFTKKLIKKAETGFYKELAVLTREFLALECSLLKVRPRGLKVVMPPSFEPDGECFSCEV